MYTCASTATGQIGRRTADPSARLVHTISSLVAPSWTELTTGGLIGASTPT
jgi:hypothetical protein